MLKVSNEYIATQSGTLTAGATTMTIPPALLGAPPGEYPFRLTSNDGTPVTIEGIEEKTTGEVVEVTGEPEAGKWSIVRGREGKAAKEHLAGTLWACLINSFIIGEIQALVEEQVNLSEPQTIAGRKTFLNTPIIKAPAPEAVLGAELIANKEYTTGWVLGTHWTREGSGASSKAVYSGGEELLEPILEYTGFSPEAGAYYRVEITTEGAPAYAPLTFLHYKLGGTAGLKLYENHTDVQIIKATNTEHLQIIPSAEEEPLWSGKVTATISVKKITPSAAALEIEDETGAVGLEVRQPHVSPGSFVMGNNSGQFLLTGGTEQSFLAGLNAAASLTESGGNIAQGQGALEKAVTPTRNIAIGAKVLQNLTGGNGQNTGMGFSALTALRNGAFNFGLGTEAFVRLILGVENTGIGYEVLYELTNGSGNVGLGQQAGKRLVEGSRNLFLGQRAGVASGFGHGLTEATAIGYEAEVKLSNTVVIGKATTKIGLGTSEPAYKLDVREGDIAVNTVGKTLRVKEGTNAKMGKAVLTAGSVAITTTAVTATSIIMTGNAGGTLTHAGALYVSARTNGTGFTVHSTNAEDTQEIGWLILEPA